MLIDWFTVAAQTLNFLVLVWLLKRFLYKPVLDAIDARERGVAATLAEAAEKLALAEQARAELEQKNRQFDDDRVELLSQATAEAKTQRERLLTQARTAADVLRQQQQQALETQLQDLGEHITGRTRNEVFAIVRKTLGDLAETTLEERMAVTFMSRLGGLPSDAKNELIAALKADGGPVTVRSAFALTSPQRAAIQKALEECLGSVIALQFEVQPALVSGIEFSANGYKLAWTIDDYLATMEASVAAALRRKPLTDVAAAPAARAQQIASGATP